ncbi:hypothetical protein [Nonomuraea gerenzanensis]|uniref:Uncharacterized protein n=1 Tax=Nonomuraea gerenzanensis TaxID=93944 RepID=A0A1M4EJY5_9ACTN|nr:hypothetical protein [Nonomuraea gerenzanensis]UBU10762.1 hypothetical protein LCN96_41535 [Nonomuraea gerenzanensis]SBO99191.1 hypothetical protein BN4615_P8707 [Nonomuraea gerenzanensis]
MTGLERGFRRLLAAYPKEHRARHEEEMVAVLLASAEPGRRRPSLGDAYDVLRGGLAIRLRHAAAGRSQLYWRDALDIAALLAPLALFVIRIEGAAGYGEWVFRGEFNQNGLRLMGEAAVQALPYGLVVLFAWLNRRWAAIAFAAGYSVLSGWSTYRVEYEFAMWNAEGVLIKADPIDVSDIGMSMLPAGVCAVMLALAPSPGPGSVGTPRLLRWTAALVGLPVLGAMSFRWMGLPVAVAVVVVAGVVAWRSPVGRRVAVVLVPVAAMIGVGVLWQHDLPILVLLATLSAGVLGVVGVLARAGSVPPPAAGAEAEAEAGAGR